MQFKRYTGVEVNGNCLVIDGVNDVVIREFKKPDYANAVINKLNSSKCGICDRPCEKALRR